jgi:hypothetical protein
VVFGPRPTVGRKPWAVDRRCPASIEVCAGLSCPRAAAWIIRYRKWLAKALYWSDLMASIPDTSERLAGHYGIVTVCGAVSGLAPHALVARTVKVYTPRPTVPESQRSRLKNDPDNVPVAVTI